MSEAVKITETDDGTIVEIFVKTRSPKFELKIDRDEIVVCCCQEPIGGRVNREIVKEFSRLFGTRVELVSGSTSRQKKFLINAIGKKEVEQILAEKP